MRTERNAQWVQHTRHRNRRLTRNTRTFRLPEDAGIHQALVLVAHDSRRCRQFLQVMRTLSSNEEHSTETSRVASHNADSQQTLGISEGFTLPHLFRAESR